jgi:hypothetical protein
VKVMQLLTLPNWPLKAVGRISDPTDGRSKAARPHPCEWAAHAAGDGNRRLCREDFVEANGTEAGQAVGAVFACIDFIRFETRGGPQCEVPTTANRLESSVSLSARRSNSGLKMRTLQNLAAQGAIPGAAKPAGRWTFDIAQLRQWARQTPEKCHAEKHLRS